MSDDINVLALVKGGEKYIFLYDDANRARALRTLGRYASSPDLSFSWYDAAILSQKIRRQTPPASPFRNRIFLPQPTDNDDPSAFPDGGPGPSETRWTHAASPRPIPAFPARGTQRIAADDQELSRRPDFAGRLLAGRL